MINQGSEQWMMQRKAMVTGSRCGAALGLNPYKTPDDLIREMVREFHGAESEFKGNIATDYGSFHEDHIRDLYRLETGKSVEETGFHVHPGHDWLGASPDGLIGSDGLIEIKAPFSRRNMNPPVFKTAMEQEHYYAQMQVQMACTGRDWTAFYQWNRFGTRLEIVARDDRWLEWAIPELKKFHEKFNSEVSNKEHLEPKRIEIHTLRAEKLVQEYEELREAEEQAKERRKQIVDELVDMSKGKNALLAGTHKLTKVERQGSVAYARALKKYAPDADLEEFRGAPSVSWRLG